MTTCCSHLKGSFYTFLTTHVDEVVLTMILLLEEFFAGIDDGRREQGTIIEELNDVKQRIHSIDIELVDHCRLAYILTRHDKPLEFFCSCLDSDRQGTTDRKQTAIKAQLTYQHVFAQAIAGNLVASC